MWWGKRGNPEATEDREWADAIAGCLALKPNYYPAIHPDKHIPSARLALLQDLVVPGPDARDHPAVIVLSTLVEGGEAYEAEVPVRRIAGPESATGDLTTTGMTSLTGLLDVDLTTLQVDPATADTLSRQLNRLSSEQRGDQLQRIERGMLRLERTNLQLLTVLQQLVSSVKKPPGEGPK